MLSAREVGIVAQRELLRNIRSAKGIAMFSLVLLGGLVFSMAASNIIGSILKGVADKAEVGALPPEVQRQLFEVFLTRWYESEVIAKHLAASPPVLYWLFWGTLFVLPILVLLVGFDQLAGELQHRTLRYSAGRAARASIVVGKALGIWGVVILMVLVLHVTVWVLVLVRGGDSIGHVLSWGGRFWLYSSVCAAAYVGYTSMVSARFRTPVVALFAGLGAGRALWPTYFILGLFQRTAPLTWVFPNAYEKLLVMPEAGQVLGGLLLFIAWGALCVAGSTVIMARRDV